MPISMTIPAAPVVLPVAALLASRAWRQTEGPAAARLRAVTLSWITIAYGAGAVSVTLFPLVFASDVGPMQVPWTNYVNLAPFLHAESSAFLQNVLLTVPLGVLAPIYAPRIAGAADAARVGAAASLSVELVQLLLDVLIGTGHIADIDDLLANTLGAAAGFVLLQRSGLVLRRPRPDAARPPAPRSGASLR